MSGLVNSGDRDDPANYPSFDDYLSGTAHVWSLQTLVERWNKAHPEDPVKGFGDFQVPPVDPKTDALETEGDNLTRILAGLQLIGGGVELIVAGGALLAPEPTATKVVGVILLAHSLDTLHAAAKTIISGDRTATFTQRGAAGAATFFGAGPTTAETIGVVTDIGIGVGGSFGVGALSKAPAGASKLVHLTNPRSADMIRASQTLGTGRTTVYAGPEALAKAKGFSILARTGRPASQMGEVILLPSQANQSFLIVRPIGPMSAWQRIGGNVFSAGTGSFNLTTGTFTRTGPAINQLSVYAIDSAIMATMRAGQPIVEGARR